MKKHAVIAVQSDEKDINVLVNCSVFSCFKFTLNHVWLYKMNKQ